MSEPEAGWPPDEAARRPEAAAPAPPSGRANGGPAASAGNSLFTPAVEPAPRSEPLPPGPAALIRRTTPDAAPAGSSVPAAAGPVAPAGQAPTVTVTPPSLTLAPVPAPVQDGELPETGWNGEGGPPPGSGTAGWGDPGWRPPEQSRWKPDEPQWKPDEPQWQPDEQQWPPDDGGTRRLRLGSLEPEWALSSSALEPGPVPPLAAESPPAPMSLGGLELGSWSSATGPTASGTIASGPPAAAPSPYAGGSGRTPFGGSRSRPYTEQDWDQPWAAGGMAGNGAPGGYSAYTEFSVPAETTDYAPSNGRRAGNGQIAGNGLVSPLEASTSSGTSGAPTGTNGAGWYEVSEGTLAANGTDGVLNDSHQDAAGTASSAGAGPSGTAVNGHAVNGHAVNGSPANGSPANGRPLNGLAPGSGAYEVNGSGLNGTAVNGYANGTAVNGSGLNGTRVNGYANGTAANGYANGTAANGYANGTAAASAAGPAVPAPAGPGHDDLAGTGSVNQPWGVPAQATSSRGERSGLVYVPTAQRAAEDAEAGPREVVPPVTRRSLRPRKRARTPLGSALGAVAEVVIVLSMALVLSLVIKTFLVQAFFIPSQSMENTLLIGDRVLVSKLTPGPFTVQHGDVVVFKDPGGWLGINRAAQQQAGPVRGALSSVLTFVGLLPQDSGEHLIKRVIGLPGDTVVCCDKTGKLQINGVSITEPYLKPGVAPSTEKFTVTVRAGQLWVMGDNRIESADSRAHREINDGQVPITDVVGKAFVVVWPFSRVGGVPSPHEVYGRVPTRAAKP